MKKPKVFVRDLLPLAERRARHALDAPQATKEYHAVTTAALDRMARLKALRLENEKSDAAIADRTL